MGIIFCQMMRKNVGTDATEFSQLSVDLELTVKLIFRKTIDVLLVLTSPGVDLDYLGKPKVSIC